MSPSQLVIFFLLIGTKAIVETVFVFNRSSHLTESLRMCVRIKRMFTRIKRMCIRINVYTYTHLTRCFRSSQLFSDSAEKSVTTAESLRTLSHSSQ